MYINQPKLKPVVISSFNKNRDMPSFEGRRKVVIDEVRINPDSVPSAWSAYSTCRSRDLCLRYLQENPAEWADVAVTPCPCSHEFYREVLAYKKVLKDELDFGPLDYPRWKQVKWLTQHNRVERKKPKSRIIPLTQSRLSC